MSTFVSRACATKCHFAFLHEMCSLLQKLHRQQCIMYFTMYVSCKDFQSWIYRQACSSYRFGRQASFFSFAADAALRLCIPLTGISFVHKAKSSDSNLNYYDCVL